MRHRICQALFILILGPLTLVPAQTPMSDKGKNSENPESNKAINSKLPNLNELAIPDDKVVVIVDSLKEAKKYIPKMVILSIEEHAALRKKIADLERKLTPKQGNLNSLKITGTVNEKYAVLRVEMIVVTESPQSQVSLALANAYLQNATIDNETPLLKFDAKDGFTLIVSKEGKHEVTLDLKIPTQIKNSEMINGAKVTHQLELSLPRAAILPPLQLSFAGSVTDVTINQRAVEKPNNAKSNWEIPFSNNDSPLVISWQKPTSNIAKNQSKSAQWNIKTTILDQQIETKANLILSQGSSKASKWEVLLPPEIRKELIQSKSGPGVMIRELKHAGLFEIEAASAKSPIELEIISLQPRNQRPFAIGPYLVLETKEQQALFEIEAAAETLSGQRLDIQPLPSLRHEIAKTETKALLNEQYRSWDLAQGLTNKKAIILKNLTKLKPNLIVQLKPMPAQVYTTVIHNIFLQPADDGWQAIVETQIQATPRLNGADFLDLTIPTAIDGDMFRLGQSFSPPAHVFGWTMSAALMKEYLQLPQVPQRYSCSEEFRVVKDGRVRVQLKKVHFEPFLVTFTGIFQIPYQTSNIAMPLPRPVGLGDKGAIIKISGSADLEFFQSASGNKDLQSPNRELHLSMNRSPTEVEFGWQNSPIQPNYAVEASTYLGSRHGTIIQTITPIVENRKVNPMFSGASQFGQIKIAIPPGLSSSPKILSGGVEIGRDIPMGIVTAEITSPEGVKWKYDFPINFRPNDQDEKRQIQFPFLRPMNVQVASANLKVWPDAHHFVTIQDAIPGNEFWKSKAVEPTTNEEIQPSLILETEKYNEPLTLTFHELGLHGKSDFVVEKIMNEVRLDIDGTQIYRCRYRLTQLSTDIFRLNFSELGQQQSGDNEESLVNSLSSIDISIYDSSDNSIVYPSVWERSSDNDSELKIYLREQSSVDAKLTLEVRYRRNASRSHAFPALLQKLVAPSFSNDIPVGPVVWRVQTARNLLGLVPGSLNATPFSWSWQDWYFAPKATAPTLLDEGKGENGHNARLVDDVVFISSPQQAINVFVIPTTIWFCICSGLFLFVAIRMCFVYNRPKVMVLLSVSVITLTAITAVAFPLILPYILMALQPGLVIFLMVAFLFWIYYRQYQKQVVYLPQFTRSTPSTANPISGFGNKELSTIDAIPLSQKKPSSQGLSKVESS